MKTREPFVCVLLSTYNGSKYLDELLDSIFAQEEVRVLLIARDDGSTDGTKEILKRHASVHAEIMQVIEGGNLGYSLSYAELMKHAPSADFYAFADQDDVWMPLKLKRACDALSGKNGVLVYQSNAVVTDEKLKPRGLYNNSRGSVFDRPLEDIIFNSHLIGGPALVFTRETLDATCDLASSTASYLDRIICLTSYLLGEAVYDDEPTFYYRQHDANGSGQGHAGLINHVKAMIRRSKIPQCPRDANAAEAILLAHGKDSRCDAQCVFILETIRDYPKSLKATLRLLKLPGVRRDGFLQTLWMKWRIATRRF